MSQSRTATTAASRLGSGAGRLRAAWRNLPHERRLAAIAAIALFLTLFLPWYQETIIASGKATKLQSATASLTGWGAFSFVEAAVLIVAIGVLTLLFQRAEGRAFHLPGGDGGVIMAAGGWTCVLVIWRMFDKQGTTGHGQYATTYGIEWGIFVALAVAAFLAYSGSRIRAAHQPEPPLPGDQDGPRGSWPPDPSPRDDPPPGSTRRSESSPGSRPRWESSPGSRRRSESSPGSRPRSEPTPGSRPRSEPTPGSRPRSPQPAPQPPAPQPAPAPPASQLPASQLPASPARRPARPRPAAPEEPRRGDWFERVVPDDPPTMKLGRPSTPAAQRRAPRDPDDQLTIPLEPDENDDDGAGG